MDNLKKYEAWFITGSQHLYGDETLRKVDSNAQQIAKALNDDPRIPVTIVFKPVLKAPEEILHLCQEASKDKKCVGVIAWMHTFSPARMWIGGLKVLTKPLLHFHTQFNRDIPWSEIDMNFINLNQSAHGDREFGFIMSRMRKTRKVVVGHWQDEAVILRIEIWLRAACAWNDWQGAAYCRFGDNMRQVAVTEGDKVEAEIQFGYSVNGFGVGDLVATIQEVRDQDIKNLVVEYEDNYLMASTLKKDGSQRKSLEEAAQIETGLRKFLTGGNFKGFTDTFEDLHGLTQLPGISVQRLMADGYGFGAEGDWKTCALVRAMKVMATGLPGGNSFMEDYTYHLEPGNHQVLGAHMLEICPSIADRKPSCEIHPLGIGGKADPVRLVFTVGSGPALNASMIDLGNRFRLLVNEVEAVKPEHPLPKLPVARVLWKPLPDLKTACASWILAGGAHHTCYSQNLTFGHLNDFAEMAGVEVIRIGAGTTVESVKNELRWNEASFR